MAGDMIGMIMGAKLANNMMDRFENVTNGSALGNEAQAAPAANTWTCSCGNAGNTGKFCSACGKPRPVRWFCPDCATLVYVQATTRPHFRTVRLGVIDQPHDLAPRMALWTSMAPEWAVIDPKIEQHRGQAPVPAATPSAGTKTS